MKATARRIAGGYKHHIEVRGHTVTVDEQAEHGGNDEAPSPQELLAAAAASCTAVTMEMYADRKGWELSQLEVECEYERPERGVPTHFKMTLRLPDGLTQEQIDALQVIAGKCPVRRALTTESTFEEQIEVGAPAGT